MPELKICFTCNESKPLSSFSKRQLKKLKLKARCSSCINNSNSVISVPKLNNLNVSSQEKNLKFENSASELNKTFEKIEKIISSKEENGSKNVESESDNGTETSSTNDSDSTVHRKIFPVFCGEELEELKEGVKSEPTKIYGPTVNVVKPASVVSKRKLSLTNSETSRFSGLKKQKLSNLCERDNGNKKDVKGNKTQSKFVSASQATVIPQPPDGNCLFHSLFYHMRTKSLQAESSSSGGFFSNLANKFSNKFNKFKHKNRYNDKYENYGATNGNNIRSARDLRKELSNWVLEHRDRKFNGAKIAEWIKWEKSRNVFNYVNSMKNSSEWGGEIELLAFSNMFNVNVNVYQKYKENKFQSNNKLLRVARWEPEVGERKSSGKSFGRKFSNAKNISTGVKDEVDLIYVGNCHYNALKFKF